MAEVQSLQVEINVEDLFFHADEQETATVQVGTAPISIDTWEQWFQTWLDQLQSELPPHFAYELSLRLTDNAEIQSLNAQYRQQDQPTDVLAFAALEVDYPQPEAMRAALPLYLGDIVISVETAAHQAIEREHPLPQELAWLATHGLLHLLGWDHPTEADLMEMLSRQETLLQTIGFHP